MNSILLFCFSRNGFHLYKQGPNNYIDENHSRVIDDYKKITDGILEAYGKNKADEVELPDSDPESDEVMEFEASDNDEVFEFAASSEDEVMEFGPADDDEVLEFEPKTEEQDICLKS